MGTEKGRVFLSARKELQADFQKFCSEYPCRRGFPLRPAPLYLLGPSLCTAGVWFGGHRGVVHPWG